MAEQLGRCEDFDSPHEYSGMTCKNWQPAAAPAPQAERDALIDKITPGNIHGEVGAAPAETARPKWNRQASCTECDGDGCAKCGGETAGEMTAEQFWPIWAKDIHGTPLYTMLSASDACAFAEAFAKQRVEQAERKWKETHK